MLNYKLPITRVFISLTHLGNQIDNNNLTKPTDIITLLLSSAHFQCLLSEVKCELVVKKIPNPVCQQLLEKHASSPLHCKHLLPVLLLEIKVGLYLTEKPRHVFFLL